MRSLDRKILHFLKYINYKNIPKKTKKIVIITGCQRSGTTMLQDIFHKDYHSKVYREYGDLSKRDNKSIRLKSLKDVKNIIEKQRANLIIFKALVETQNIKNILDYLTNSFSIFIYRDYKDVINSNLNAFGIDNGINDIRPIANDGPDNWRSEMISIKTKNIVKKYFSNDMSPYDAAGLFWYTRNILFYQLNLNLDKRVILCNYKYLVKNPDIVMRNIYEYIGYRFPGKKIVNDVFTSSLGKGKNISLSPDIEYICRKLLTKLNETYNEKPLHMS